jgi:hypothetical protein
MVFDRRPVALSQIQFFESVWATVVGDQPTLRPRRSLWRPHASVTTPGNADLRMVATIMATAARDAIQRHNS